MAERNSEYERITGDDYATPAWVTRALLDTETFPSPIWECAPGEGYMVRELQQLIHPSVGAVVATSDNFLSADVPVVATKTVRSIITNPPYVLADQFCRRAISMMMPRHGKVAMLLPMSFDCAKGRRDLFADCAQFKCKLTLTRRIRWANIEQKKAGPSMNHAWFVWSWDHRGLPTIRYLPIEKLGV
jgi:hypothetical protein